jgi:hypothetical protein
MHIRYTVASVSVRSRVLTDSSHIGCRGPTASSEGNQEPDPEAPISGIFFKSPSLLVPELTVLLLSGCIPYAFLLLRQNQQKKKSIIIQNTPPATLDSHNCDFFFFFSASKTASLRSTDISFSVLFKLRHLYTLRVINTLFVGLNSPRYEYPLGTNSLVLQDQHLCRRRNNTYIGYFSATARQYRISPRARL